MSDLPYDALLLLSFGGPEKPDDVWPFLHNVVRGRNIPDARLEEVVQHYLTFGGVSPINQQCRDLLHAIEKELTEHHTPLALYWGNRNWHPYLTNTLQQMQRDGVQHAAVFTTAAYSSYSSCRQYLEDIEEARTRLHDETPHLTPLRRYHLHPGFIDATVDHTLAALTALPEEHQHTARLLFTAHSIPTAMADTSGPDGGAYTREMTLTARAVIEKIAAHTGKRHTWDLVWQSRSGNPATPWLEPDICDHLTAIAESTPAVVVTPIGFISDHMEVIYDLDHEAAQHAKRLGMHYQRAATVGVHPRFVAMVRSLIEEPPPAPCPPLCCLSY